ncbi:hypothetical protein ACS0TY_036450 [Phlomoides rotata]
MKNIIWYHFCTNLTARVLTRQISVNFRRFANLNLSDFVSPYFHAKTVQEMWGGSVKPVPHPDHRVLPEWINSTSCDPPM